MAETKNRTSDEPEELGHLLLDIGAALLESGDSSASAKTALVRIASAYRYEPQIDISPKSISLSLRDAGALTVFSDVQSIAEQGVNFKVISGLNRLGRSVAGKQYSLQQAREEVDRLLRLPQYPRWVALIAVSVAGAAFCYTFGGGAVEMGLAFGATFAGLFVKQELVKKSFNAYVCTYLSALTAVFFVGIFYKTGLQAEHALATSVLFLIPGVPLINSLTDLLEGEVLNGLERGINALMHALAIAFGLSTVLFIFNYQG